jgi:hypothetical protein
MDRGNLVLLTSDPMDTRRNLADPFSRCPDHEPDITINALLDVASHALDDHHHDIKQGYLEDAFYQDPSHKRLKPLREEDGLWNFRHRLCIPDSKPLRQQLLRESHDTPYVGHQGKHTTLEILSRNIWRPRMVADVTSYVRACHSCQVNKPTSLAPAGLLQPLAIPNRCWDSVSVDFMTTLPKTAREYDAIAVFVDRLSKYVHIIPTKLTITAIQFANIFRDNIFRLHGMPLSLISDCDPCFTSDFWTILFKSLGTHLNLSTAYHPQADGQTKNANRHIGAYLRHYIDPYQKDWDQHLTCAEFALNNHRSSSTGFTPFYMVFGQHPHTPLSLTNEVET